MTTYVRQVQPNMPDAIALIDELDSYLTPLYPNESRHGYSVDKLIAEGVAFFVLYSDDLPAACGGVKLFGGDYGELKRMYVRPQQRGRGFAKQMVLHIEGFAHAQQVDCLRLETGVHQAEAIGLYERMGFVQIGPFGSYKPDPLSLFYEKRLG